MADLHTTTERLRDLAREAFGQEPVDRVGADATFEAMGADSLDRLELVMQAEEEFGVELPDAEVQDCDTVEKLAEVINGKLLA